MDMDNISVQSLTPCRGGIIEDIGHGARHRATKAVSDQPSALSFFKNDVSMRLISETSLANELKVDGVIIVKSCASKR